MFKCIHGIAPNHLSNSITMACETSDRQTRLTNSNNVALPEINIEKYRKSFLYSGAVTFNALPDSLKNMTGLQKFKLHYKKMFFKQ